MIDPKKQIDTVDIQLKGFTVEELKDIIGYLRSVEDHRPTRFIFVNLDMRDQEQEEAEKLIKELWPDEESPKFVILIKEGGK